MQANRQLQGVLSDTGGESRSWMNLYGGGSSACAEVRARSLFPDKRPQDLLRLNSQSKASPAQ